jgi:hypothetical protein
MIYRRGKRSTSVTSVKGKNDILGGWYFCRWCSRRRYWHWKCRYRHCIYYYRRVIYDDVSFTDVHIILLKPTPPHLADVGDVWTSMKKYLPPQYVTSVTSVTSVTASLGRCFCQDPILKPLFYGWLPFINAWVPSYMNQPRLFHFLKRGIHDKEKSKKKNKKHHLTFIRVLTKAPPPDLPYRCYRHVLTEGVVSLWWCLFNKIWRSVREAEGQTPPG